MTKEALILKAHFKKENAETRRESQRCSPKAPLLIIPLGFSSHQIFFTPSFFIFKIHYSGHRPSTFIYLFSICKSGVWGSTRLSLHPLSSDSYFFHLFLRPFTLFFLITRKKLRLETSTFPSSN